MKIVVTAKVNDLQVLLINDQGEEIIGSDAPAVPVGVGLDAGKGSEYLSFHINVDTGTIYGWPRDMTADSISQAIKNASA